MTRPRIAWLAVLARAVDILGQYDTGVTLRQLLYRLLAAEVLPNTTGAYKRLSTVTAKARREGTFPNLIDRTRTIHRFQTFNGASDATGWLQRIYRRDRTEGQTWSIYLGVEKAGIVEQLEAWFGDFGVPILALGGYSSQSYVDEIVADVADQDRPAVLIYGGDFDPSGEDIDRDFRERTGCFTETARVALTAEQVDAYELPEQMGKTTDSRAGRFIARHGRLVQVELDAVPPDPLRHLYEDAIAEYWVTPAFQTALRREDEDRINLGTET